MRSTTPLAPAELDRGPSREDVQDGWVELAAAQGFVPQTFWTLTFDEDRIGRVDPQRALGKWRWLVRVLNRQTYGPRVRQWCKHSAFSYIAAVDYSRLGAVHLHVVVDGWVDLRELHRLWNAGCGYAWISMIDQAEEVRVAIAHVVKYATKGSDRIVFWFNRSPQRMAPPAFVGQSLPGRCLSSPEQGVLPGFSAASPSAAPAGEAGSRGLTGVPVG